MSRAAVEAALAALPRDVEAALATLAAALGEVIKPTERAVIARWLWQAPPLLPVAREIRQRFAAPVTGPLEPVLTLTLPVAEASGLAISPRGTLCAVDDDRGLFEVEGDHSRCLADPTHLGLTDLEGLCAGPDGHFLLLSEGGEITEVDPHHGTHRRRGRLPTVGRRASKGYEGIDLLTAEQSPLGCPTVVAVNEREPAVVVLAPLDALDRATVLALPSDLAPRLDDLSDVAVHPSGDLILLSDESRTVARVRILDTNHLVTVGCWALDLPRGVSPEGLTFDAAGQLWVAADGAHEVFAFWLPEA